MASSNSDLFDVFVICAPGMEAELRRELEEIRPLCLSASARFGVDEWQIETEDRGGLTLKTTLISALQVNFWSKLASRVLIRIDGFHAASLPRLRERLKSLPLKKWIGDESFEIRVEAHRCKVSNEKTIRRVAAEVCPVRDSARFRVYVRGWQDDWMVSLEASGEHLHRRGFRQKSGGAPLRETLAALTLRHLVAGESVSALRKVQLLDPMAGTGTFLREAQNLFLPQRKRDFAFLHFKNCPALLKSPTFWDNYKKTSFAVLDPIFESCFGIEQDKDVFNLLRENMAQSGQSFCSSFQNLKTRADLHLADNQPLWLVTNPPYGKRLEDMQWMDDFWPWALGLNPDKIAIWLPRDLQDSFLRKAPYPPRQRLLISNGGLPCTILFFSAHE